MNIGGIIVALLVFSFLIFIHELGHFLAARSSGVTVNEFALGMGPVLFSFTRGETKYSLRAIPMGGFCAMEGEDEDSSIPGAFCNASIGRRILIMAAGSLMNLLLGLLLLGFLTSQQDLIGTTTVAGFNEGAVSSQWLQAGDEIIRINGNRVRTDNDLVYQFQRDRDGVMDMEVLREGEQVLLRDVRFDMYAIEGVQFISLDFKVLGVEKTAWGVVTNSFNWTKSIIMQVWGSVIDLVTGRYSINQLAGPVGTTSAIGEATSAGIRPFLMLVTFITINLGVFNLLPLPALDGGRMLFLLLELVRRKPVNPRYEGLVHATGFALLIGLMIFVTFNDIIKLFILGG